MADVYKVNKTDLLSIANKIRSKTGKKDTMIFPSGFTQELDKLKTEEIIQHANIPDYVKKEVLEVANKVNIARTPESIVFLAMSDSHYYGTQGESGVDSYVDADGVQGNTSNLHGAMGAKILAYLLKFDFMAHLGDATWGFKTTHSELLNSQIDTLFDMLGEAHKDIPCFHAIGNHDTGYYYHNNMKTLGNTGVYTESGQNLYNKFTSLSASDNTVFAGEQYGGYCYRDFESKKLRVFLLHTAETHIYNQTESGPLGSQLLWFANALDDLNSKSNATDWSYIVLSHYPADYSIAMPLSNLLGAYVQGSSIEISLEDGTKVTKSFTGKNGAKFIAQFHGHVHNFITSKLTSYATGKPVQYDGWRMCIPNGQYDRENYYTTVGNYPDINFGEDTTYSKTPDTAEDTSFVVNVINPSEKKIYSFCYGAGIDRVIGYGKTVYYVITSNLSNVTAENTALSIEAGESYSNILTLASGCDMKTITVTMDDIDISTTAISIVDGKYHINIPEVTGKVVITAKAQARPNFINLVPFSINTDGTDYNVDGDGYDNDNYLNSSGTLTAKAGITVTGFIPVKAGAKTIRVAGEGIAIDSEYTRFAYYNSSFGFVACTPYRLFGSGDYQGVVKEEASTVVTFIMDNQDVGNEGVYLRVSTKGNGANLIVTVDEEITYGGEDVGDRTYTVEQKLTNITSDITQGNLEYGSSFQATLSPASGYELGDVTITMGGVNITASSYSNGQINISSVIGNIVITATGKRLESAYTNLLPKATDTDGSVYNGKGYKEDTYISDGVLKTRAGIYTSGFIPCTVSDTLYFKNVVFQDQNNNHRIAAYDADKNFVTNSQASAANVQDHVIFTYGSDGNIDKITFASNSVYYKKAAYIRFCCGGLTEDSVVAVNQPVE